MWKPGRRFRIGASLSLGVLVGVILVAAPALISPTVFHATSDSQTRSTNGLVPDFLSAQPATSTSSPTVTGPSSVLPLALSLFLILLPASVLSFLAKKWAARKLPDYWYD